MANEVWAQSARKHRVSRDSTRYVMTHSTPQERISALGDPMLWWEGPDAQGRGLEVGAVVLDDGTHLVIHSMPLAWRKK